MVRGARAHGRTWRKFILMELMIMHVYGLAPVGVVLVPRRTGYLKATSLHCFNVISRHRGVFENTLQYFPDLHKYLSVVHVYPAAGNLDPVILANLGDFFLHGNSYFSEPSKFWATDPVLLFPVTVQERGAVENVLHDPIQCLAPL